MRLAAHNPPIVIGEVKASLRPSLRAAYLLFGKYEFNELVERILAFELTVIKEVIEAGSELPNFHAAQALESLCGRPLGEQHRALIDGLIRFVVLLMGIDPDQVADEVKAEAEDDNPKPKPLSYTAYCEHLFRIGAGWMGWTPKDTWAATPAEIIEAYKGRQEMLKAIFGGNEQPEGEAQPDFSRDTKEKVQSILGPLSGPKQK